jgi:hypothetical protein
VASVPVTDHERRIWTAEGRGREIAVNPDRVALMDRIRLTAVAPLGVAYFGVEKDIEIPVAWNNAEAERRSVVDLAEDLGGPEIQWSTLGQRRGGKYRRNEARDEGNERKLATSPRTSMEKHRSLSEVVSSPQCAVARRVEVPA